MSTRYPQDLSEHLVHVALGIYVAHLNNSVSCTPEQAGVRARVLVKHALAMDNLEPKPPHDPAARTRDR